MVVTTLRRNVEIAQAALASAIENLDDKAGCSCHKALDNAIMTEQNAIPQAVLERLKPIISRAIQG
jgi:5'-methylthioadenosine phosphorylase